MTQDRVVTRVKMSDGSTLNVRNDEMDRYIAAHPGAEKVSAGEPEVAVEVAIDVTAPPAENEDKAADAESEDKGTARGRGR